MNGPGLADLSLSPLGAAAEDHILNWVPADKTVISQRCAGVKVSRAGKETEIRLVVLAGGIRILGILMNAATKGVPVDPFDPNRYGAVIAAILREKRLMPLGPGSPNPSVRSHLDGLSVDTAFAGKRVQDEDLAAACLAGLWLYHDFLDESHTVSQSIHTSTGSYWHGIMHRREPDAANAAYWFRRVGEHPVFPALAQEAQRLGYQGSACWDPFQFIDACERRRGSGGPEEEVLWRVQGREWELLFDWCYRHAVTDA